MAADAPRAVRLLSRGVLRLAGDDTIRFLQGLVTVDVHRLCGGVGSAGSPALYGAFLDRRGRVAHTAFLVSGGASGEVLLDVARDQLPGLRDHLTRHRLRARVAIDDASAELAVLGAPAPPRAGDAPRAPFFADPRLRALGARAVVRAAEAPAPDADAEAARARWRVLCGVPGGGDLGGGPLPLALGLHCLGAVAFDKGCYLGQELTARTHFTGVLRRRLVPVAVGEPAALRAALAQGVAPADLQRRVLSDAPELRIEPGAVLHRQDGKPAGTVTSAAGNVGLAVLKLQDAFADAGLVAQPLKVDGARAALAWRPDWWGGEAVDSSAAG